MSSGLTSDTPGGRGAYLWAGTLAFASLEERARAAVAGGFASLSMFPTDYWRAREGGVSDQELLELHERAGLRLRVLDPFARWLPTWEPPPDATPQRLRLVSTAERDLFEIAGRLGIDSISAVEPFGVRYPTGALVEAFAAFCERAKGHGLRVHLEFTPFGGIPDLTTAWEIVRTADMSNGGLVFDTWHYLRGRRDDALLAEIPGEKIFGIQISDAATEPIGTLSNDTWRHRRLPGDGSFDLDTVLRILARKPGIAPPGIEVLSEELWRLPPAEVGRRSGAALARQLEAIGGWGA